MANDLSLPADLVVLITGAAQGIGRGLAETFARHGARLVLGDRDEAGVLAARDALRAQGHAAESLRCDITQADDNAALVALAVQAHGRLDLAICNAGISQVKPFMDLTADDWQRMLGVNVAGTFLTLQAAARQMRQQAPLAEGRPRGKILTLASIAGRPGAGPIASVIAPYRASKAAVISLTQSAAYTLAPDVTVNALCPGIVATDMWTQMDRDWTALNGQPQGEAFASRVAAIPMGRAQQPSDVANLALYLASSASDYMTGQSINIDGGLMMS
ncbi:SDR family oxidoreductase [Ideonella sp. DXS22W]|uniref:SDR family oxidoreductase n=1 Tax=Pseudaquabacterium inlustre TaxID=2984192 RepID=A0ABU9CM26_9BURK